MSVSIDTFSFCKEWPVLSGMIVWAAQTRVHYMFLVSRCRCNSFMHTLAVLHKEANGISIQRFASRPTIQGQRPRLPRVGLTGICNIASAHPPFNMSLQKRTGIAGPGFDAGFGGLVDRSCFWNQTGPSSAASARGIRKLADDSEGYEP